MDILCMWLTDRLLVKHAKEYLMYKHNSTDFDQYFGDLSRISYLCRFVGF